MQIVNDVQLDFSDVLIRPRRSTLSSRKDVDITREYKFKWCPKIIKGTGIMQANMGTVGNFALSRVLLEKGLFACLHKHYCVEDLLPFYKKLLEYDDDRWMRCLLSIGLKDNGMEKLEKINDTLGIQVGIKLDVPNGYIPQVKERVIELRKKYPEMFIMVGNVVTGDIAEDLILSGADCLCAGIGGGSQCLTRKQTGVGRPQLSTIIECADACHQVGGLCCSDGGITCPGDIGKAFGAGADFVMIGGLFAGCDEAEGDVVTKYYHTGEYEDADPSNWISSTYKPKLETKKFKLFYGMSSTYAQEKFGNGKPDYRASEGRVALVPYTGFAYETIEELLGGLRSTMTYIGARRLKDIPKQCVFYKVHNQLNRIFENNTIGK